MSEPVVVTRENFVAAARSPLACGVDPLSERSLPVGSSRRTPNHMHMTVVTAS